MRLVDYEDADRLIKLTYALHMLTKLQFRPEGDLKEPIQDLAIGVIGALEAAAKRYVAVFRLHRGNSYDRNRADQEGVDHEAPSHAEPSRVGAKRRGKAIHDEATCHDVLQTLLRQGFGEAAIRAARNARIE
jgi:hypothetical protein